MHAHLGGECPHRCAYCYVDSPRFGRPAKFTGPLRMLPGELDVVYTSTKTVREARAAGFERPVIFVDHCNDICAEGVPLDWTVDVMNHCATWPEATYVFQTKNPGRFQDILGWTPPDCIMGCTIETNRDMSAEISDAPRPVGRACAMRVLSSARRTFITIEPIMDFDVPVLGQWLLEIRPEFVNIGADSKGHHLPEPSAEKVLALVDVLRAAGIEIRGKHNLARIVGEAKL
jgi:DNA repair photolyase